MDRLETLVQDVLAEHAHDAPPAHGLLAAVTTRPSRTQWYATLAAAAIVLVVAGALVALHTAHRPATESVGTPAPTAPVAPPAGTRWASYHQISVAVPTGLPTRGTFCDVPVANAVVAPTDLHAATLCPRPTSDLATHPGTVVWLGTVAEARRYAALATFTTTLDGTRVRRGYGSDVAHLGRAVSGVVVVSSLGLVAGVTAPTRAQVDAVLDTLQIGTVDPLGCPARESTTVSNRSSSELVPAGTTGAVWCVYEDAAESSALLTRSYRLGARQTARLRSDLNALRPDPCACVHGGTAAPGFGQLLRFGYPLAPTRIVVGEHGANLDTFSDGQRVVANYSASVTTSLESMTR